MSASRAGGVVFGLTPAKFFGVRRIALAVPRTRGICFQGMVLVPVALLPLSGRGENRTLVLTGSDVRLSSQATPGTPYCLLSRYFVNHSRVFWSCSRSSSAHMPAASGVVYSAPHTSQVWFTSRSTVLRP